MEEWREIPDLPEAFRGFEASTHGRIRDLDGRIVPQWSGGTGKNAYLKVWLGSRPNRIRRRVHLLIAAAFLGPAIGRQVRHRDGDKKHNEPSNLRYGSNQDNVDDMMQHGTHWQVQKSSCPASHQLEGANLIPSQLRRGWRQCLACDRARKRVRKDPKLDFQAESDQIFQEIMDV